MRCLTNAPRSGYALLLRTSLALLLALCGLPQLAAAAAPDAPRFSSPGGFYPQAFDLKLSAADSTARIYYTLDGSLPDPDNLEGQSFTYKTRYTRPPEQPDDAAFSQREWRSHLYSDPIRIEDRSSHPDRLSGMITTISEPDYLPAGPQQKGRVVRAISVDAAGQRSEVATHTYFIGPRSHFPVPVVALTVPEQALFDYQQGILVPGQIYDSWQRQGGQYDGPEFHWPANWSVRGKDTRAHIEYFPRDGQPATGQPVSIRNHGNSSRSLPLKSLRIQPKAAYGSRDLQFDIFDDGRPLGRQRINLRNGGWWGQTWLKDGAVHRIMAGLNVATQQIQPVVVFINGEYYGLLNARERKDSRYLAARFNLAKHKQLDLISVEVQTEGKSAFALQAKTGTDLHWQQVLDYVAHSDRQAAGFMPGLEQLIDVDSFIDYYAASIFLVSHDWPVNNNAFWRYSARTAADATNPAADGRWRWLLYDRDNAFHRTADNTLEFATRANSERWNNPDYTTFMLRSLLENPAFAERFVSRFNDLLNTSFMPERMIAIIDDLYHELQPLMPQHIQRWSAPADMQHWQDSIEQMREFARQRPAIQRQHLQAFFNLGEPYRLQLQLATPASGSIRLGSLHLGSDQPPVPPVAASQAAINLQPWLQLPWQGQYLAGAPLQLQAIPASGMRFDHWLIQHADGRSETRHQASLSLQPDGDLSLTAVMQPAEAASPAR